MLPASAFQKTLLKVHPWECVCYSTRRVPTSFKHWQENAYENALLFYFLPICCCLHATHIRRLLPRIQHNVKLPDGARARLGKGGIYDVGYFRDGSRFAVASSIGVWIYDAQTGEALALLNEQKDRIFCIAFRRMELCLRVVTMRVGFFCGTHTLVNISAL